MMPTQAKSRVSPVDAALQRLLDLSARAASPSRMAREVQIIAGEWQQAVEDDAAKERLAALLEQLDTGVIDAEEQVSDVDQDQPAAVTQANATLAAMVACREAARAAMGG